MYSQCPPMKWIPVTFKAISGLLRVERKTAALVFDVDVDGVTITFEVTFPRVGGVRVRCNDGFFAADDVLPITYTADGTMTAGRLTAKFKEDNAQYFTLTIANQNQQTVFSMDGKTIAFGFANGVCQRIRYTLPYGKNEVLYGMGERYESLNLIGTQAYLWNVDTAFGKNEQEAYQNIPFLHSTAGYAAFFNTMYAGVADFGMQTAGQSVFDFNGPICDVFVFVGTPTENMDSYTQLTGRPILVPKWSFQYWMGASWGLWNQGEVPCTEKFRDHLKRYAEMGIHHIAGCYAEGLSHFPEAFEIAKENGDVRIFHWNHPSLEFNFQKNKTSLKEMAPKLTGSNDPDEVPIIYLQEGDHVPMVSDNPKDWIDFTHPRALQFIESYYQPLFDSGLKGAMIDYGEFVRPEAKLYNGKDGNAMHNEHSYWYGKTMHDLFEKHCGDDYILFCRSGCAGAGHWTAHFGGDQACTFRGMHQALAGGLNAAVSGLSTWGSDIGGLGGHPTNDLYIRWLQYSTFSPLMRAHAGQIMRNPWEYGDKAVEVFKIMYWWRENMLPYSYHTAIEATLTGTPMMRPMPFAYPKDETMWTIDDQYLYGSEMLVAPVCGEGENRRIMQFPAGIWTNLWNGSVVEGGRRLSVEAPIEEIPVYLRAGAVVPLTLPADTLQMCENMENRACVTTILTTPATATREITLHLSKTEEYRFTSAKNGENAITLTNADGMTVGAVCILGVAATRVVCDGEEVSFTAAENKTTIALPNGFREIVIY